MEQFTLGWIDISIMLIYIIAMIWYGLKHAKQSNSEDYFLAGRNMTWPIVGISLFAANISSTTLIGLAGDAYSTGISVFNYEWSAVVILVFFSMFFLPFYLKSKVYTMPEFLEKRFDSRSRYYFSFTTLIGNVLIETAAPLYIGSLIFEQVFPTIPGSVIIIILAVAAAAYTIPGGLSSVVHTEVIQAILLIIGSIILTYMTFEAVGGWGNVMAAMESKFAAGDLKNSPEDMLSLIRPMDDPGVPWTGLITGVPILGFYFWANNQFMVQRVLSARNLDQGRKGALFGGLLKLPVILIMVLPGTMAIAMPEHIFPALDNPDLVYPALVFNLLPVAIKGLVLAGLLAAMSSSISATLNSASTLITMDFVSKLRPGMTSKQLVRAGQIATVILVILAASWAPNIKNFDSLFKYLQIVLAYIAPPVVAAFLLGLFWKRANGTGAFAGFIFGFIAGILLIQNGDTLAAGVHEVFPKLALYNKETATYYIHFLHIATGLFFACVLVIILVSLVTAPPPAEKIAEMTYKKDIFTEETRELKGKPWYENYRTLSIILLLITAVVVGIFW
ncbi:sodium:solute symporter [Flexithrix dorotheae]|uniref:sodium:solute symporter n=1 Tax=Flexithrix dorotheae TaxID=70993 RepID=UPI00037E5D11|nr:sodium:solute symporter [Flexithrix dorotheae]